ncbi:MAG: alpha/beta hydrolase, partial [Candidatus Paceibacterota bacterium]
MRKKWLFIGLLLIIAIPILLFFFRKDNILTREEAIALCLEDNAKFYTWNDLEIHYTEEGKGAETILMVHGFGGSHKNFTSLSEILKENYRVIAIDLPAFGLSEVPSSDIADDQILGLYQSFMSDALTNLNVGNYHLIGNSLGGWMSWDLATRQD